MATFRPLDTRLISVFTLLVALLLGGCGQAPRPTLVPISELKEHQVQVDIELPPAPKGTMPLPAADANSAGEPSIGDAIHTWALQVGLNYVEECSLVEPNSRSYCSIRTGQDQVRLIGHSDTEIHYVVVVEDVDPSLSNSYRVTRVLLAGE